VPPIDRYSAYDGFARVYDRHWGPQSGQHNLSRLQEKLLPGLPVKAQILDLCCGTGQLCEALHAQGYVVTGLDGSEEAIRLARGHAPEVEFLLADARSFSVPRRYDAVVSVFDSLNHVMTLEELVSVFECVHAALHDDGLFWFDLNREYKYRTTWCGNFSIVSDDQVCLVKASYDEERRIANFDATVFEKFEEWKRNDISLTQTWYADSDILSAVRSVGFRDTELSYSDPANPSQSDKAFFVAKKLPA
jgi:SAM-dependent methyltransferase